MRITLAFFMVPAASCAGRTLGDGNDDGSIAFCVAWDAMCCQRFTLSTTCMALLIHISLFLLATYSTLALATEKSLRLCRRASAACSAPLSCCHLFSPLRNMARALLPVRAFAAPRRLFCTTHCIAPRAFTASMLWCYRNGAYIALRTGRSLVATRRWRDIAAVATAYSGCASAFINAA